MTWQVFISKERRIKNICSYLPLISYNGETEDCPGGCSYYRQGHPLTPYCFGPGERTASLECPVSTTEDTTLLTSTESGGSVSADTNTAVGTTTQLGKEFKIFPHSSF